MEEEGNKKEEHEHETAPVAIAVTQERDTSNTKRFLPALAFAAVVLIIILCAVLIPNDREPLSPEEEVYVPETVDFQAGVSLITAYDIQSIITSRLATTTIVIDIANALRCSSIRSIALQLPLGTRVASLHTVSYDDDEEVCRTNGKVQRLEEARETFLENASEGLPGAYIEEHDSFTHSLQVAIPPLGKASVELVLEQLLHQRLGKVVFDIPFSPNEKIDSITLDLTVEGINDFVQEGLQLDFGAELKKADVLLPTSYENSTTFDTIAHFVLDLPDAREYIDLPRLVRGSYVPQEFPENGILYTSEGGTWSCFEHYFRPPDLESMAKNIVFVVDTTLRDVKLNHTKEALKSFISTYLTERDSFYIQLYGREGTVHAKIAASATVEEKNEAIEFIDRDWERSREANLHAAFLEGLLRAKSNDQQSDGPPSVNIVVFISNSWANEGEQNRKKIVDDIYNYNFLSDGKPVKIFSLGFEDQADMALLNAIAVTNDGVSVSVGGSSYQKQIENFFESEFGDVLLADANVEYSGGFSIAGETPQTFSLLSDGYEVVVRGLLVEPETLDAEDSVLSLQAKTTAVTSDGNMEWQVSAIPQESSLCFQSYAHARIDQLLRLRDMADLIGNDTLKQIANLVEPCLDNYTLAECFEEEATRLALAAGVVAKGITSMVTVDEEGCLNFEGETNICRDGTDWKTEMYLDRYDPIKADYGEEYYEGGYHGGGFSGSSTRGLLSAVLTTVLVASSAILLLWIDW